MFEQYLFRRTTGVEVNGARSSHRISNRGVPQGSIVGPTLFNVFIDPILRLMTGGLDQLYADDEALAIDAANFEELFGLMQRALDIIVHFLQMVGLSLNAKKSEYLIMRHQGNVLRLGSHFSLEVGGEMIRCVRVARYLGCLMDDTLSFEEHIGMIMAKMRSSLFALRRSRHFLTLKAAWSMYYAHIHSHVVHLCPIWTVASNQRLRAVEVTA